jgi:hypothetical protein
MKPRLERSLDQDDPEWAQFTVMPSAESIPAFEVFVETDAANGGPFRTLVWRAVVDPGLGLVNLVQEYFRLALRDPDFLISSSSLRSKLKAVIKPASAAPKRMVEMDAIDQIGRLQIGKTRFVRIEHETPVATLGMSYMEQEEVGHGEIALMMQYGLQFASELLPWVFRYHHDFRTSRNTEGVDSSEMLSFLNGQWLSGSNPGTKPAS